MYKEPYHWQYDYVRLAFDAGFSFERHKAENLDKSKICAIDIDNVIKDRDIATVEKFIPYIMEFILDMEQAKILDDNFVKTFRLAQLAIEYLLFCKKYLDNTLVLLKKQTNKIEQENKELKLFVDELKDHISILMKDLKEKSTIPAYRCEECNKVFSTDEFLNSHKKRRHSNQTKPALEAETDKLHLEIKELKGRLNSAERLIQKEQTVLQTIDTNETELTAGKVTELQQKFEDLKLQVESELKILRTHHQFDEKYEQLLQKLKIQDLSRDRGGAGDLGLRRESTTQTELDTAIKLNTEVQPDDKINEDAFIDTQKQITELGEALEIKVSSSLQKIENQMETFWQKLSEVEERKQTSNIDECNNVNIPPPVNPRSKFSYKNTDQDIKEIPRVVPKTIVEESKPEVIIQAEISMDDLSEDKISSSDISTSDIESITDTQLEESVKPAIKSSPSVKKNTESKLLKQTVDDDLLSHFKEEIEKIISSRLQDLGVSPEWKGIPFRSFQRAIEIVNHQASLMKKTHPNFDQISAQIEKTLTEALQSKANKGKVKLSKSKLQKNEKRPSRVLSSSSKRGKVPSPVVEIKNRSMYETDSDSEIAQNPQTKPLGQQLSLPYSAVIEELKSVTTKIDDSDKSASISADNEKIAKPEDQTKGVLKSYPSMGSLTKKKVLFNLDDNVKLPTRDGGSTTSIASSVLDGSPKKRDVLKHLTKRKTEKNPVEDLSDFDFSEM